MTRRPASLPIASAGWGANYLGIGRVRKSNGRPGEGCAQFVGELDAMTALRNGTVGLVIPAPFSFGAMIS